MAGVRHTPGPWLADTTGTATVAMVWAVSQIDDPNAAPIADCADYEERRPVEEARANAHLAAAAPSLLTALRLARAALKHSMDIGGIDGRNYCVMVAADGRPDLPELPLTFSDLVDHIEDVIAEAEARA